MYNIFRIFSPISFIIDQNELILQRLRELKEISISTKDEVSALKRAEYFYAGTATIPSAATVGGWK